MARKFWRMIHAFRYFFKPSSTKLSKVYASTATSSYFPPTLRYFRSILRRDFAGRRKMGTGSGMTRGEISAEGRSRRVGGHEFIAPRRGEIERGFGRKGKGWRTMAGNARGWDAAECVAYYTLVLFIILYKYRSREDARPQNAERKDETVIYRGFELVSPTSTLFFRVLIRIHDNIPCVKLYFWRSEMNQSKLYNHFINRFISLLIM